MSALLLSSGIVALAEIGDKTQLLAFVLAARFRKPGPIILAILLATLANHAIAAALGLGLSHLLAPQTLRWLLGLSFLAMAAWTLIPDKLDEAEVDRGGHGVFMTTLLAFFIAEMGDKTQLATAALAARYEALTAVLVGSTLGMMLANVPAVLIGHRLADRLPIRLVHGLAALLFAVLGLSTLLGAGAGLGL